MGDSSLESQVELTDVATVSKTATKNAEDAARKKMVRDAAKSHQAGEGIAGLAKDTNTIFRVTSYELFVKPNYKVAIPGTIFFVGCVGFIAYMKLNAENAVKSGTHYVAYNDKGEQRMAVTSGSKWD